MQNLQGEFSRNVYEVRCMTLNPLIRRRVDLRNVPSLVPESHTNETAHAIKAELINRKSKLKERLDAGAVDQDTLNNGMFCMNSLKGMN